MNEQDHKLTIEVEAQKLAGGWGISAHARTERGPVTHTSGLLAGTDAAQVLRDHPETVQALVGALVADALTPVTEAEISYPD
ncbi:hypothetical protein [Paenirhodobacter populi]|uniref:Uncharacterized protein n=1 Tax=Paenirhodobacter populi TaxID=2306993 RepID=A0A443J058_9RHOB|nr:hypothetical protein [Sinirhodobacter populi]RWR13809.1 hypothetical protein D2T33_05270 [Sinirhodobacter populi]